LCFFTQQKKPSTERSSRHCTRTSVIAGAERFGTDAYITGSGTLTLEDGEQKVELTAARKIDVTEDLAMSVEAETVVGGETAYRRVYAKDGMMYFSLPAADGQAQNVKITTSGASSTAPTNENAALLPSDFQQGFTKETKDGETVFTLTVSGTVGENPTVLQLLDSLVAFPELDVKSASGALLSTLKSGNVIAEKRSMAARPACWT
jgi:hypothetical protein